jgi:hypothetical protein
MSMGPWDQLEALAEIERSLAKAKAAIDHARMRLSTMPSNSPDGPILHACLDAVESMHAAIEAAKRAAVSRVGA